MHTPSHPGAAARAVAFVLICLHALPAHGQASLDPRALDALAPPATKAPPAKAPAAKAPAKRPAAKAPATAPAPRKPAQDPHAHPNGPHQTTRPLPPSSTTAASPAAPAAAPTMPAAPPPAPSLPPPIAVPVRPQPPPPLPAVSASAGGAAARTTNGLRLTFDADSADLNPATEAALRALVTPPPPGDSRFDITAYAHGTPDDPSTARRLSLSRALAVRSVLINAGIPSPRILVKALGAAAPTLADGPPDRVDIGLATPPAAASATPASTAPASGQPAPPVPPQKAAP